MMVIAPKREEVIENIKNAVKEENYNVKVEIDDPELTSKEKKKVIRKYLRNKKGLLYRLNNIIAKEIVRTFTWKENKETEVIGLENVQDIQTGAIITSNHFSPTDNIAIKKFANEAGKRKIYIVSQETNLAMNGFIGYIMKHSNLIPISNQVSYMKKDFPKIFGKALKRKNYILIYPEEEMWFNYKKPRKLKPGAYYYASKYNVPIISCFVEIVEKPKNYTEEFKQVKYKVHVLKPIYPDSDKSDRENAAWMCQRDYAQKAEAYEKAYNKKLDYKFENDDIAGWIVTD